MELFTGFPFIKLFKLILVIKRWVISALIKLAREEVFCICCVLVIIHIDTLFMLFEPPPLGEKGSYDFTTVCMSVDKRIFSKTAHRICLKLLMKLGCLQGKKIDGASFLEKNLIGDHAQKHNKNRSFWILQKKKKKKYSNDE